MTNFGGPRVVRLLVIGALLLILAVVGLVIYDSGPPPGVFSDDSCLAGPVGACGTPNP